MSDDADATDARTMIEIDQALKVVRSAGPDAPITGFCLNCGPDVPLPSPMRWCDGFCMEDWEHRRGATP